MVRSGSRLTMRLKEIPTAALRRKKRQSRMLEGFLGLSVVGPRRAQEWAGGDIPSKEVLCFCEAALGGEFVAAERVSIGDGFVQRNGAPD